MKPNFAVAVCFFHVEGVAGLGKWSCGGGEEVRRINKKGKREKRKELEKLRHVLAAALDVCDWLKPIQIRFE